MVASVYLLSSYYYAELAVAEPAPAVLDNAGDAMLQPIREKGGSSQVMKNEIPAPVVAICIVVVVLVVSLMVWKGLSGGKPAVVPGGVHVTPPSRLSAAGRPTAGVRGTGSTGQ